MASKYRSLTSIGPSDYGREVTVAGWVEDVRNLGGIAFLILRQRDGTLQVTLKKKADEALFRRAAGVVRESVVAAHGVVHPNSEVRNDWEIVAASVDVLAQAGAPLPLPVADKVGAEMDTRLDNRFLDLRKPERRAIFRVRAVILLSIRSYLEREGFVEVQTPKLAGAGAEGGATLFETSYFGRRAYLSQSPQLYKQILMSTGLDRVFEIGPAFRAEPSDTVRHVTEFTSFDAEMAWIDSQEDFLTILEGVLANAIDRVRTEAGPDLEQLGASLRTPSLPLKRLEYREDAFFIVDYPTAIKPFYIMPDAKDPEYSLSFDLEYRGDEMASGGQREHRYEALVERLKAKGLDPSGFDFYLRAFRYGMPPHGGWGFGVDRFVQKVLGLPNIREAILFPRDRARLLP